MAHPDLNKLLNALLPFAQDMLEKHGEFFPFGAAVRPTGKVELFGGDTGTEQPPSQQVIDLLLGAFKFESTNGRIIASGICLDVRTVPPGATAKTDAVCLWLEHSNGEAIDVYLPYQKVAAGQFEYGQLFASPGGHGVFGHPEGAA